MKYRSLIALALGAVMLAACGQSSEQTASEPDTTQAAAADLAALESARPGPIPGDWDQISRSQAQSVFAQMCASRAISSAQCECMVTRLDSRLGPDAVFATAVAYGNRADLALEVSERLTEAERIESASAYLNVQRQCRADIAQRESEQ